MKYSIQINQKAIVELNKETGANLDLKDAAIISFFKDYTHFPKVQKQIIDNEVFYWVSYQWIIDENPLLEITDRDIIGKRIEKICDAGIFQKFLDKKQGNKIYLAFGENYQRLITDAPTRSKQGSLPAQKREPLPAQKRDNYNTNILGNKRIENKKESIIDNQVDQKEDNLILNKITSLSLCDLIGIDKENIQGRTFSLLAKLVHFLQTKNLKQDNLPEILELAKEKDKTLENMLNSMFWGGWIKTWEAKKAAQEINQFTITKDPNFGKTGISYSYYLHHWNKGEMPEETTPEFLSNYFFN